MLKFDAETVKLPCAPVTSFSAGVAHIAATMFELVDHHQGLGLAANQVGLNKQIIVINCSGFRVAIVNPKIMRAWGGLTTMTETCLSAPGLQVRLTRYKRVKVAGFDVDGVAVLYTGRGIVARVFQHEIDHMAGITIQDRKRLGVFG